MTELRYLVYEYKTVFTVFASRKIFTSCSKIASLARKWRGRFQISDALMSKPLAGDCDGAPIRVLSNRLVCRCQPPDPIECSASFLRIFYLRLAFWQGEYCGPIAAQAFNRRTTILAC